MMKAEKLELKFVCIDFWNRPVFKDDKGNFFGNKGNFFGNMNVLFSHGTSGEEVLKKITENDMKILNELREKIYKFKGMLKKTEILIKSPKGDVVARLTGKFAKIVLETINNSLEKFEVKTVEMETPGNKRIKYKFINDVEKIIINNINDGDDSLCIYLDKGTVIYKIL